MFQCSILSTVVSEALGEILISTYSPNKEKRPIQISVFHDKESKAAIFTPRRETS